MWKSATPKTMHETLCNDYKAGGLKRRVIILNKIIALHCSWVRKLYDNYFYEWKLIPFYLIKKSFDSYLNFIQIYSLRVIKPSFSYLSIEKLFCTGHLAVMTEIPSCIFSQYPWHNANIQVDKTSIHFSRFSMKNIHNSQLFSDNGSSKNWH